MSTPLRMLALTLALPLPALATDEPSVHLDWTAPEGCVARADLAIAVSEQLGRDAFVAEHADLEIAGTVEPADAAYRATVILSTGDGVVLGRRTLDSDGADCHTLDEAIAIVVAMMLNVRPEDLPPRPSSPWGMRIGARVGVVLGLMPRIGLETTVAIGVDLRAVVDFGVEGSLLYGDSAPAAGGAISTWGGAVRLYVAPRLVHDRNAELSLRVAAGIGALSGTGVGFSINYTDVPAYIDLRAGLRGAVRLVDWLWLDLSADLGVLPWRPMFQIREVDGSLSTLFESQPLLGSFLLGLSARPE